MSYQRLRPVLPQWFRSERRDLDRIPVQVFLNEYVADRPQRGVTANISPTGVYVNRVFGNGHHQLEFGRENRFVQLEFALPGTGELIWARGEVRHDELGVTGARPQGREAMVHGTGIRFSAIARGHARLIRDYVHERRRKRLVEILDLIRKNRYH